MGARRQILRGEAGIDRAIPLLQRCQVMIREQLDRFGDAGVFLIPDIDGSEAEILLWSRLHGADAERYKQGRHCQNAGPCGKYRRSRGALRRGVTH